MSPWIIVGGVVLAVYFFAGSASAAPVLSDREWAQNNDVSATSDGSRLQRAINRAVGHIEKAMSISRALETRGIPTLAFVGSARIFSEMSTGEEVFPRLRVDGIVGPHTQNLYSLVFGIVQGAATGVGDFSVDRIPASRGFEGLVERGSDISLSTMAAFNDWIGGFPALSSISEYALYRYIGDMGRQVAMDEETIDNL